MLLLFCNRWSPSNIPRCVDGYHPKMEWLSKRRRRRNAVWSAAAAVSETKSNYTRDRLVDTEEAAAQLSSIESLKRQKRGTLMTNTMDHRQNNNKQHFAHGEYDAWLCHILFGCEELKQNCLRESLPTPSALHFGSCKQLVKSIEIKSQGHFCSNCHLNVAIAIIYLYIQ